MYRGTIAECKEEPHCNISNVNICLCREAVEQAVKWPKGGNM